MASCIASRVPDPTDGWPVRRASPRRTTLRQCQWRLRTIGYRNQSELLESRRMAAQIVAENVLAIGKACGLRQPVEPRGAPRLRVALDEKRAVGAAVAVGMRDQQAIVVLAKDQRQRIEQAGRSVPRKQVRPHVDRGFEVVAIARTDCTGRTVGRDDEIAVGELVQPVDLAPEFDRDAKLGAMSRAASATDRCAPSDGTCCWEAQSRDRGARCASRRARPGCASSRRRAPAPRRARTPARCR